MKTPDTLLAFALERQRYALPLSSVKRVIRAVEITALPKAPDIVLGVINVRGRVIPVVDVRKRFGLPKREMGLNDQLIIAETPKRPVALFADRVDGVFKIDKRDVIKAERILPGTSYVERVVKLADDLLLIHDLSRFLALDEEKALSEALKENKDPQ